MNKLEPRRQRVVTPFLGHRDQLRILVMVGLLSLVIIAIQLAARPESWHWLIPPTREVGATSTFDQGPGLEELDFRVRGETASPWSADEILAAVVDYDNVKDLSDRQQEKSAPLSVDVPTALLETVEDNTLGVRSAESAAYYDMITRIQELPAAAVTAAARDDVAFTVLMLNSDSYRGRLLTVTGDLRRLMPFPLADDAPAGIERLYEGWLTTADSGTNPYRFLCTELPEGITTGEALGPLPITVTGYFFKRYGYASKGGMHLAPTLLSKTFLVRPAPVRVPAVSGQLSAYVFGFFALIAGALALAWWRCAASDQRYDRSRLKQLADARLEADNQELAALGGLTTSSPGDFLLEMGSEEDTP